ncbi:hypothetical protein OUZ56_025562 [Daphnia magna]|uniref:Uncharacterized protein n=1 Tax=Daphnia magna TaxID=35525 RepID=A0ABQ9ZKR0_9CRUS|nr:hypothetical protein OUZ56_025562 [Daphnia magna]
MMYSKLPTASRVADVEKEASGNDYGISTNIAAGPSTNIAAGPDVISKFELRNRTMSIVFD